MSDTPIVQTAAEAKADLERAGRMLEDAVQAMRKAKIAPHLVATALLGGAVHILGRVSSEEAVIQVLQNAIAGVRGGDLRRFQR